MKFAVNETGKVKNPELAAGVKDVIDARACRVKLAEVVPVKAALFASSTVESAVSTIVLSAEMEDVMFKVATVPVESRVMLEIEIVPDVVVIVQCEVFVTLAESMG